MSKDRTNHDVGVKSPSFRTGILLILLISLLDTREAKNNEKKDLSSPVFGVEGQVYKEKHIFDGENGRDLAAITVRGVGFEFPGSDIEGQNLYDSLQQNEKVLIEYSPNSRHIWKL